MIKLNSDYVNSNSSIDYGATRPNQPKKETSSKRKSCCGCSFGLISIFTLISIIFGVYLTSIGRSNILLLGIDSRENSNLGRSDTIILVTIVPSHPYIGMLSVPRDLWVEIPGYGWNRINAAHFFGEANQPGSGPSLSMTTVSSNFGVDVDYYVSVNHVGFLDMIDHLGGIDVDIEQPVLGLDPGTNHLNSQQALAIIRDRSGSDDFSRMKNGQIFIKALLKKSIFLFVNPNDWSKIPTTLEIITRSIETNLPFWRLPQFGITLLLVGLDSVDSRIIERNMVRPFVTSGGANVLEPQWEKINPLLLEMFEQ